MGIQLPECVTTEEKQRKLAEEIATRYHTRKIVTSKLVPLQGTASITLEVALEGEDAVIIQFRIVPLDIKTFAAGRRFLRDGAPSIETVEHELLLTEHVSCVLMTKMPCANPNPNPRIKTSSLYPVASRSCRVSSLIQTSTPRTSSSMNPATLRASVSWTELSLNQWKGSSGKRYQRALPRKPLTT
ncbi:hypothetical protein B0J13DRAFT_530767 [Dactylonectria estremocensis]|uniref:Uncharacterized protein n=1 Tax=Dactylonectria estremocensis TaxID=1079267 RepID=A0A9P9DZR8_9HYPO|nr:hypothetical protein B0J13DRAFT_530767 [Dactylonectria estremocensis]